MSCGELDSVVRTQGINLETSHDRICVALEEGLVRADAGGGDANVTCVSGQCWESEVGISHRPSMRVKSLVISPNVCWSVW